MNNNELIAKAKEAKSAEELLVLAKENSIELTEEQAQELFDRLHSIGELSDDELDDVAGGKGCFLSEIIGQRNSDFAIGSITLDQRSKLDASGFVTLEQKPNNPYKAVKLDQRPDGSSDNKLFKI